MALAALAHDVHEALRRPGVRDAVGGVAVGAHGGTLVALGELRAVHAGVERLDDPQVAAAARRRNALAVRGRLGIARGKDLVVMVAVGAGGRDDEPGGLDTSAVDALEIFLHPLLGPPAARGGHRVLTVAIPAQANRVEGIGQRLALVRGQHPVAAVTRDATRRGGIPAGEGLGVNATIELGLRGHVAVGTGGRRKHGRMGQRLGVRMAVHASQAGVDAVPQRLRPHVEVGAGRGVFKARRDVRRDHRLALLRGQGGDVGLAVALQAAPVGRRGVDRDLGLDTGGRRRAGEDEPGAEPPGPEPGVSDRRRSVAAHGDLWPGTGPPPDNCTCRTTVGGHKCLQ